MNEPIDISGDQGAPSFKFERLGDKVAGIIISATKRQQTDITTGEPLTFTDGNPKWQWVITLDTGNGELQSIYAKGGKYEVAEGEGTSMLSAIGAAAYAATGQHALTPGDELAVAHSGMGKRRPGLNAPKLFKAAYKVAAKQSVPLEAELFSGGQ